MKNKKYIIIDDSDIDRLTMQVMLKNYPTFEHQSSFSSSEVALNYIKGHPVDIIFLDINMPKISGIDFFLEIKKMEKEIVCVYITAYPEFAVTSYEMEALDYIVKPLKQERLNTCMKRLVHYFDLRLKAGLFEHNFEGETIQIKEGHNYINIQLYEITHLEALKDYTKIYTLNKTKIYTVHSNLGSLLETPCFSEFVRIHKSYAIQQKYTKYIKTNEVELINKITLPIGRSFKKELNTTKTITNA